MQPTNSTKSSANREIAATVSRLLAHFWTGDDPPEARQAQLEDWIEDLREFGPEAVADACREWRQTQARRPVPADIRLICIDAQNRRRERDAAMLPPPEEPPDEPIPLAERQEVGAKFGELAEMLSGKRPWPTSVER